MKNWHMSKIVISDREYRAVGQYREVWGVTSPLVSALALVSLPGMAQITSPVLEALRRGYK